MKAIFRLALIIKQNIVVVHTSLNLSTRTPQRRTEHTFINLQKIDQTFSFIAGFAQSNRRFPQPHDNDGDINLHPHLQNRHQIQHRYDNLPFQSQEEDPRLLLPPVPKRQNQHLYQNHFFTTIYDSDGANGFDPAASFERRNSEELRHELEWTARVNNEYDNLILCDFLGKSRCDLAAYCFSHVKCSALVFSVKAALLKNFHFSGQLRLSIVY